MSSRERREMREHMMKVAAMEEQVASLETKNAELRERLKECEGAYDVLTASIREKRQRINDLEAENDKLREDLEFERSENGWAREFLDRMGKKCGTKDCPSLVAYVDKLESENAKMRQLIMDMYKAFMHGNCYRWCEFKEPCNYISDGRCQWYDRMLELGME